MEAISSHQVISIVGNVKNAGKTTVLNKIVSLLKNEKIALTSIGLDGEKVDQITFKEKPEVRVFPGMYIVTASEAVCQITGKYEVISSLGITSALGEMMLIRIVEESLCLLAGPATVEEMEKMVRLLSDLQLKHIFIDGAFSRKASSQVSDGLIYVVGASFAVDDMLTAAHAKKEIAFLQLKQCSKQYQSLMNENEIIAISRDGAFSRFQESSLFQMDSLFNILPANQQYIYLPKSVSNHFIKDWLIKMKRNEVYQLIIRHPFYLQISNEVKGIAFPYKDYIEVIQPIDLIGVCVNPVSVYDEFHIHNHLKKVLEDTLNRSIINVCEVII